MPLPRFQMILRATLQQVTGWNDQQIRDWLAGWRLPDRSSLQFRLRSLFIVTTLVAVGSWVVTIISSNESVRTTLFFVLALACTISVFLLALWLVACFLWFFTKK